jgi:glycosyltransferase involved in cell wall biosynthesis
VTTVSVIITTFNRAELLVRAIDSVVGQTYPILEIIVVDDASSDDTQAEVNRIGDDRLAYFLLPKNMGPNFANNFGLANASGDWVAFLDSDDIWKSDKIERQMEVALKADCAGELVISCKVNISGVYEERIRPKTSYVSQPVGRYLSKGDGLLQTEFAKKVGFDDEIRVHTDLGFCIRLAGAGAQFFMLPEALVVWWEHEASGRVSKGKTLVEEKRWLRKYKGEFHLIERVGFRAKYWVPKLIGRNNLLALFYLLEAGVLGVIGFRSFFAMAAQIFLPNSVYGFLRSKLKA